MGHITSSEGRTSLDGQGVDREIEDTDSSTSSSSGTDSVSSTSSRRGTENKSLANAANQTQQEQDDSSSFLLRVIETSTEDKTMNCFKKAQCSLMKFKAAANVSSLNTAIYLLQRAAFGWPPADPELPECLNHLATALLIRFIYAANVEDIYHATTFRDAAVTGKPVQSILEQLVQNCHEDYDSMDMMNSAVFMLKEFFQAHDTPLLENAILLYQETVQLPESHFPRWKALSELSDALLIQFHLTGNAALVNEAISCLKQVRQTKPNRSICLFAALITCHEGPMALLYKTEGPTLQREVIQIDQMAQVMWQQGQHLMNLFKMHHDLTKLEAAVKIWQMAESLLSLGYKSRDSLLNSLGTALHVRFEQRQNPKDLDEALELHAEALEIRAAPHSYRSMSLTNLANAFRIRFTLRKDPEDLDKATELHREALELCDASDPQRSIHLTGLATTLTMRAEEQGDPNDLYEAIELHREALRICTVPDCSVYLNNLASALLTRFEQREDTSDIDEAIALHQEALKIRAAPHSERSQSLYNLASALQTYFKQQGDPKNLDKAIAMYREVLQIHNAPRRIRNNSLSSLAAALQAHFKLQADLKSLDEAVALHREALENCAAPHPNRGTCLNNLAYAVKTRFHQQGNAKDLDESIKLNREALVLRPAPHPDRRNSLNNLANGLKRRFEQQGIPKDLDEAVALHREALQICAPPHPNRSQSLSNLASALWTRFRQRGDPNDIDEAIALHREGVEIHATFHSDNSIALDSLANSLCTRFEQWGDPKDLHEAIELHTEALKLCAAPHPNRSTLLNSTGLAFCTRFEQQHDPKDLDEAIQLLKEALEIRTAPHPARSISLNNLANTLETRFTQQGVSKDLNEAVDLRREALELCDTSNSERYIPLSNLAGTLWTRFQKQWDSSDRNEAIALYSEALEICRAPHPGRGKCLVNFGSILYKSYLHQPDAKSLDDAISAFREASTYMSSPPLSRLIALSTWAMNASQNGHRSGLDAYQASINLLPQLAAFHLDLKSRHQILTTAKISALASDAANCAIFFNQNNLAVEFLEASRSVFWAQALHLRTPLDDLENVDPELACKLRNLSQQLEHGAFRESSENVSTATQSQTRSIEAVGVQCRRINEEWDEILKTTRKLTGFDDFLKPKRMASLCQAAVSGPVIILLTSGSTCSALIVKSSGDVQHVQLPSLNIQTVAHYSGLPHESDLEARLYGEQEGRIDMNPNDIFRRLLADVWNTLVKPVFEAMSLKKSENPPRLWWCPTGPFAFIPIHAAGIYDTDMTDCVSDYVISSYTPTLAALLDPPAHTAATFKMTAVIEPHAPNSTSLPGTAAELDKIRNRVPHQWLTSLDSTTRDAVMRHLHNSSVVHFACHGTQNLENPLDSSLILSDGHLKVSQIMRAAENDGTDRMRNIMKLAVLSACETARGDANTPDEAMHLAATLLFAGFRGVVATMWTMNDYDGPMIADTFYNHLFKECNPNSVPPALPDLTKAAEALHFAVAKLRKEPGMTFQRWVPFVHYGL
ncbi:tetratricopeptide repeat-containing protein [Mycena pura]|uniref:Tetratricopeptide repeat-containing protein n=1 Tax=Mycena pura TaxID=153505 RepID=A0AAD6VD80_9AGAR|nr:tetratricopeptide repeat-containing protein [Mycena pura]